VPRRNVDKTGAGRIVDERIAGEKFTGALDEWVLVLDMTEVSGIQTSKDLISIPTALLSNRWKQYR